MCEHTHHQTGRPRPTSYSPIPVLAACGPGYALFIATITIMAILFCPQAAISQVDCSSGDCCDSCLNASNSLVVTYGGPVPSTSPLRHYFHITASVSGMSTAGIALKGTVTVLEGGYIAGNSPFCDGGIDPNGVTCTTCVINETVQVASMGETVIFKLTAITSGSCVGTERYFEVHPYDSPGLPDNPNYGDILCEAEINDPVNAVNGSLYLERTDVVIESDIGSPIVFSRHYNSLEVDTTARWRHSYQYELHESWRSIYNWEAWETLLIGDVVLVEGDGRTTRFRSIGTVNIFGADTVDQPTFRSYDPGYRLEYDLDTEEYTVVTDNGTRLAFEGTGGGTSVHRLTETTDRLGNTQTMTWTDGELRKIYDGNGKELNLTYVEGDLDVLAEIRDKNDNTLVRYHYWKQGETGVEIAVLDSVHYADGSWEYYEPARNAANDIGDYWIEMTETSDGATWNYGYYIDIDNYSKVQSACNSTVQNGEEFDDVEFVMLTYTAPYTATVNGVVGQIYETTVEHNHDATKTTEYYAFQPNYSSRRDLIEIVDNSCGGCGTVFTHDLNGQRTSIEYGNERVDRMRYDERGNMDTLIRNSGTDDSIMTTYEYHESYNLVTKITSPSVALPDSSKRLELFRDLVTGNTDSTIETGWYYNDADSNYACTTRFYYNDDEQLEKIDGPRPADSVLDTVGFVYYDFETDTTRDLKYVKFPYGNTIEFGKRAGIPGSYPWIEDANGVRTEHTYDARGRIASVKENSLASAANQKVTDIDLNFKGEIDSLTLPLGNFYKFHYDTHGHLTSIENRIGEEIRYQYNDMSVMEEAKYYDTTNTYRRVEQYEHNWKSQLIEHNGNEYLYNAMGQVETVILPPISPATVSDSTYLEYDPYGRLESVTEVVANSSTDRVTTEYAYDDHGNLTTVTDPEDNVYSFKYDDRGLLMEETSGEKGTITYRYDEAGNMIKRIDGRNATVEYEYDAMNRLTDIHYPNDPDVSYTYDVAATNGMGRLSSESKTDNSIDYSYDAFGRLTAETHVIGDSSYTTRYAYNKNDGLLSVKNPSGVKYTYEWDTLGRVDSVTAQFGAGEIELIADSILYEPFGGISTIRYANGIVTNYSYDDDGRLDGISTGADSILSREHEYDDMWNVSEIADLITPANDVSYEYTRQNRLRKRTIGTSSLEFAYQSNGNRSSKQSGWAPPMHIVYDYSYTGNRLTSVSRPSPTPRTDYGYDAGGNMLWEVMAYETDTINYYYDDENRLVWVDQDNVNGYNTRSQRQTLTSQGVTDTYLHGHNGLLMTEYQDGDWETDYIYLYGRPIARTTAVNDTIWPEEPDPDPDPWGGRMMAGGIPPLQDWRIETTYSMKWYHNDHLGTPLALTRSNKSIAWEITHESFGQLFSETGNVLENHRFPGQYHDRSTGLYYNQHRFYRPDLGRYLTPDPIGLAGGLNMYGYAGQNPINYIDPWGLRDYSCIETLRIIEEAGDQNLFEAAWNHSGGGKYDYKYRQTDDTFDIGGRVLGADEFGNYLAGYVGFRAGGMLGYNGVRAGGVFYDFKDNLRFDILGMFTDPRPKSDFDWDEDSKEQINAGAIRGLFEEIGITVDHCRCK